MICQTSGQNSARFLALHFPRARSAFSHRDGLETHLQNLNVPSRVLLCLRLALPAPARRLRACAFLPSARPAARTRAGRPSITTRLPPGSPPRPVGRQVGPHLRTACPSPALPSARLRGWRCRGEAPLSPRPGLDRCAQVTGRSALGARRWRPGIRRIAGRFVFADTCFGSCVDPRALTAFIVSPNRKNSDAYLREGRVSEDTCK